MTEKVPKRQRNESNRQLNGTWEEQQRKGRTLITAVVMETVLLLMEIPRNQPN